MQTEDLIGLFERVASMLADRRLTRTEVQEQVARLHNNKHVMAIMLHAQAAYDWKYRHGRA